MKKIKIDKWKYYDAILWCMTNIKGKTWSSDPTNHELSFKNPGDAFIVSLRFG